MVLRANMSDNDFSSMFIVDIDSFKVSQTSHLKNPDSTTRLSLMTLLWENALFSRKFSELPFEIQIPLFQSLEAAELDKIDVKEEVRFLNLLSKDVQSGLLSVLFPLFPKDFNEVLVPVVQKAKSLQLQL
jgi:hypothetical protein